MLANMKKFGLKHMKQYIQPIMLKTMLVFIQLNIQNNTLMSLTRTIQKPMRVNLQLTI